MHHDFTGLAPSIAARPAPIAQTKDSSDATLIARVATGNRLAMQVLFARHHAGVYRFILRLVGSEAAAEDLTSEVFLCVWRQAPQFAARSSVTTWLLAIARYKAIAELRRRPVSDVVSVQTSNPADDPEASLAIKHRGESCAIASPVYPRGIARSSISCTIMKNRCGRRPKFSGFPAIPSKPACFTRARGYRGSLPNTVSPACWDNAEACRRVKPMMHRSLRQQSRRACPAR
jgi:hypothetical protein